MSLAEEKKAAREAALARRDAAHAALKDTAPPRLAARILTTFALEPGIAVSGYWPGRSELDIRPVMAALESRGHPIGLPVVAGRGKPLLFRRWKSDDVLESKPFGLKEPLASAPELTPQVLLVPLLAFDREGYRIGYGAGYYDMTLASLRARGKVLAIGVGYAAQGADRLPHDERDERLDWIVTEEGAMSFDRNHVSETGSGDL